MDFLKTFVKYYLLSRWNKIPKEGFELLEKHWKNIPNGGLKLWLYNSIKKKNLDN